MEGKIMMVVTIELITRSNLRDVFSLFDFYRQFYGHESNMDESSSFIIDRLDKNDAVIFVAYVDGQPVGFTQLYPSFRSVAVKRVWILNDLFVSPPYRKIGVAKMLIDRAKEHGKSTGEKRLSLATASDNQQAQNLYSAYGFERDSFVHFNLPLDS
jgi:GNAT superfamily N-acetyltransferase